MSETKACIILIMTAVTLFICCVIAAGCVHDLAIMRGKLDAMQAAQAEQEADVREVKTDAEIILRLAAGGEFIEGEK